MSCKPSQDLIDAYMDGELDLVRSLEIEQHLKECPACARAYEKRKSLQTAVKAAPFSYAAPADLINDVRSAIHRATGKTPSVSRKDRTLSWSWNSWLYGFVSAVAIAGVGLLVVPKFSGSLMDEHLSQEVVTSHVRSLMAHHLTDVENSNQHVVKPWFNGHLDFAPPVRDFSDHGFPIAGGRLDYIAGRTVAAIVYYRAAHPINLFIWPTKSGESLNPKSYVRQGYNLIRWSDGGMTYWVISDVNEHELKDFADLVQKGNTL